MLAMCVFNSPWPSLAPCQTMWYIYLWPRGLWEEDEHPACTPVAV